jgi:hypothetical protein
MLEAIPLARQEYISVYGEDDLVRAMGESFERETEPEISSDPEPSSNTAATRDPLPIRLSS